MIAQIELTAPWISIGGLAVTWLVLLGLWLKQRNELSAIRSALKGTADKPIDELLVDHFESKRSLEAQVADLQKRVAESERWMDQAIAYAGANVAR